MYQTRSRTQHQAAKGTSGTAPAGTPKTPSAMKMRGYQQTLQPHLTHQVSQHQQQSSAQFQVPHSFASTSLDTPLSTAIPPVPSPAVSASPSISYAASLTTPSIAQSGVAGREPLTKGEHGGSSGTPAATTPSNAPAPSPPPLGSVKRDLVKTELCLNYKTTGHCPYGDRCFFAHGESDLRSRTRAPTFKSQPCPDPVRNGFACQYATRCHFCHPGEALRRATDCPKDKYLDEEYEIWMRQEFGDYDAPWGVYV